MSEKTVCVSVYASKRFASLCSEGVGGAISRVRYERNLVVVLKECAAFYSQAHVARWLGVNSGLISRLCVSGRLSPSVRSAALESGAFFAFPVRKRIEFAVDSVVTVKEIEMECARLELSRAEWLLMVLRLSQGLCGL